MSRDATPVAAAKAKGRTMNYKDRENDTFANRYYWYFEADDNTGSIDAKKKEVLDGYDRVYEARKWMKFQSVHHRVTFERKPFSPIGELRWWSVNGTPFGTAEHTYLHDALVHPFAIHYSWAIHDIVYTKRKKQKLWTKPFLSALLKGLGYELV